MSGNVFFDVGGNALVGSKGKAPTPVMFPICLAIKCHSSIAEVCPDFIMNVDESWVFVRTGSPLPEGTQLTLHFYIPPESKLLAEIRGRVIPVSAIDKPLSDGMLIRFAPFSLWKLKRMERYSKGERPLVDRQV